MNAFMWQGQPSIFATAQALRHAKSVATSEANAKAQIAKRPRVEPQQPRKKYIRPLMAKSEKRSAGPQVNVDMARLVDLKSQGLSIQAIAEKMGHGYNTIVSRLRGMK